MAGVDTGISLLGVAPDEYSAVGCLHSKPHEMEGYKMNPPVKSKINYTQLGIQIITVLVLSGVIPEKYETAFIAIAGLVLPTLTQTFRTWFTEKKAN